MANTEQIERRNSERRAENWRILFGPSGQLSPGYLADMSPTGVSILSEIGMPVGTAIEIHFGVKEGQSVGTLQMRGVVRHCAAMRIGVQFVEVDPSQLDHWWRILRGDR